MEVMGQIKLYLKLLNYILSEHNNNSVNYLVLLVLTYGMMVVVENILSMHAVHLHSCGSLVVQQKE